MSASFLDTHPVTILADRFQPAPASRDDGGNPEVATAELHTISRHHLCHFSLMSKMA